MPLILGCVRIVHSRFVNSREMAVSTVGNGEYSTGMDGEAGESKKSHTTLGLRCFGQDGRAHWVDWIIIINVVLMSLFIFSNVYEY